MSADQKLLLTIHGMRASTFIAICKAMADTVPGSTIRNGATGYEIWGDDSQVPTPDEFDLEIE